ncbi:carbohydrate ABC transporter permease [Paenibacillus nasutitermitis]|uniref:Sugar ABC transporter permease n=1 Tax=Paenibacillus nasutitermitis TaxID=1652958 RepID=A0A917DVM0_9BACL|nr:carbohydrate ABC transporter permease [Paenibacillus nasutitermitis]GGD72936.1 sugar ABC transporter permease [Paenibacillus nasutitermitis]
MIRNSPSRILFEVFNYTAFTLFTCAVLIPFLHALAISLSDYNSVLNGSVRLWPVNFNIDGYLKILTNMNFIIIFANTVGLTVVNTSLSIAFALAAGYVLASKHLIGRKMLMTYFLIPMYFSGGLIPFYLTVTNLHMNNTYFALIVPLLVNVFYVIIFRNSIAGVPAELAESGEMDGAGDLRILVHIIFPVISPMVAAFAIFSAIAYWNEWFNTMIFIQDPHMYTLQYWLRQLMVANEFTDSPNNPLRGVVQLARVNQKTLAMSATLITIIPIALVYPFLQRFFIHGIIVGAVKG